MRFASSLATFDLRRYTSGYKRIPPFRQRGVESVHSRTTSAYIFVIIHPVILVGLVIVVIVNMCITLYRTIQIDPDSTHTNRSISRPIPTTNIIVTIS
jgi:hypothetical protein